MNYSKEKMYEALRILVGKGDIKNRLIEACNQALVYTKESDFLDDLQERYFSLYARLTSKKGSGDKGAFRTTIEEMTDEESFDCIEEILSIYSQMLK